MFVRVVVAIIFWLLSTTLHGQEGSRLALVIGNQGYVAKVGPLRNPHNDVNLMAVSYTHLTLPTIYSV